MSIGHPVPQIRLFQIWPWKSKVKVMVNIESHNMGQTFYRLTSLSFHVNRLSHSWDKNFSTFDLENPRSRSCLRGKLKVTTRVQHFIDLHPFHPMSIGHPIPEIRLFQNLTLKIQGQGHGWGQSWKSQHGSIILSTHILSIPCQSAIPFLRYDFLKIWPWKSKAKIVGEGNVQSHKVGVTNYRLPYPLSFHVNRPSIPEIQHFQILTLKIQGQGRMTMILYNYMSRQFYRALNGENPSNGYRDMGSASLATARPTEPWWQYPSSPKGWGVKNENDVFFGVLY